MRAPHIKRSLTVAAAGMMLAGGAAVGAAGTAAAAPAHAPSVASHVNNGCGWWDDCDWYGYGYNNGYYGYNNGYYGGYDNGYYGYNNGYGGVAIVVVGGVGGYGY
ncbi:hypothetical protein ACFC18_40235 [Streptomyces sp. NPDC056121]|uniref:hypothetical protein n=1 Tax=unclassified Streptomyces TaxID=2593676 RepID=UPI0030C92743